MNFDFTEIAFQKNDFYGLFQEGFSFLKTKTSFEKPSHPFRNGFSLYWAGFQ